MSILRCQLQTEAEFKDQLATQLGWKVYGAASSDATAEYLYTESGVLCGAPVPADQVSLAPTVWNTIQHLMKALPDNINLVNIIVTAGVLDAKQMEHIHTLFLQTYNREFHLQWTHYPTDINIWRR